MRFRNLSFVLLTACGAVITTTDEAAPADAGDPAASCTDDACEFGCNVEATACNECAPDAITCDGASLETCGADGLVAATETCALGCVDADATRVAQCAHIVPDMLESACESLAAEPSFVSPAGRLTLDTSVDATCNGGLIFQQGGPEICVVRAGTIVLNDVKVKGTRPIAFVADGALDVKGLLDVSADRNVPGPGGSVRISGDAAASGGGGGGSGFKQVGALGGGSGEFGTGAGAPGPGFDPIGQPFQGGATPAAFRGSTPPLLSPGAYVPARGAGGGALMLVACRGTVTVSGAIDAAGGGGGGGGDAAPQLGTVNLFGGAAGGSGGYVVLQGAQVTVSGSLFANGGAGGGGCGADNCIAAAGQDGKGPTSTGIGGQSGFAARGGDGGTGAKAPTNGSSSQFSSPGGGGASVGRFQVFVPAGVTPTLTPANAEPAFETTRTIATR